VKSALALAAMLSGLSANAGTVDAAPCAPHAALAGDAAAVAQVAAELKQLGVAVDPEGVVAPRGCPVVVAAVELDRGGGIAVAVRDASHRSEGRVVSDASLAAAWIDSWLRDDFEAPQIEPPMAVPKPLAVVATTEAHSMFDRYAVIVGGGPEWSTDGTRWTSFTVSACARIGAFCVGARAGYAEQALAVRSTAANRSDLTAVATASLPIDVGRMSMAPEVGVGLGRFSTSRIDGCKPVKPICPPTDPTCPPPCMPDPLKADALAVGDHFTHSTIAPRATAALRVAVPLFDHVWLDGIASVTYSPLAHGDDFAAGVPPPVGTLPADIALPGEPAATFHLGIGLRVGAK
jgi:hypothetical protein